MSDRLADADFLAGMALASAARVDAARAIRPPQALRARLRDRPHPVNWQRSSEGFDLIAEVKWRSPAVGALRTASPADLSARLDAYTAAGATAISVLTEPTRFEGSLEYLEQASAQLARRSPHVPALRKDFLVDAYQLLEARAAGAGGVLLIARMLEPKVLANLLASALEESLCVLLEIFDEADVERSMTALAALRRPQTELAQRVWLGVNSRDLVTLQVVPDRLESMVACLPREYVWVAESGVASAADAARLASVGYDAALVGSALMASAEPATLARAMLQAAREARGRRIRADHV